MFSLDRDAPVFESFTKWFKLDQVLDFMFYVRWRKVTLLSFKLTFSLSCFLENNELLIVYSTTIESLDRWKVTLYYFLQIVSLLIAKSDVATLETKTGLHFCMKLNEKESNHRYAPLHTSVPVPRVESFK